jgi:hypothetical protein
MENKNEYFDDNSDIFTDEKFAIQFMNQIKQKYTVPSVEELKNAINNLKIYSELPDNMHIQYVNSPFINELYDYYKYLENRRKIVEKL